MRYSMKIAAMFALSAPLSLAGCMAASGDDGMDEPLGEADGALDEEGHGGAPVNQAPVYLPPFYQGGGYPMPGYGQYGQYGGGLEPGYPRPPVTVVVVVNP